MGVDPAIPLSIPTKNRESSQVKNVNLILFGRSFIFSSLCITLVVFGLWPTSAAASPTPLPTVQEEPTNYVSEWSSSCERGANRLDVERIGLGLGNRNRYSGEPKTLTVNEPESVQFIIAQVITRSFRKPERVDFITPTESTSLVEPSEEIVDDNGNVTAYVYQVVLEEASQVSTQVIGAQAEDGFYTPRSFTLFVFRTGEDFAATGATFYDFVFNSQRSETLTIAPSTLPRDVVLQFDLIDLAADDRYVTLMAEAGPITATTTEDRSNQGDELTLSELLLPNVPGDITEILVTIESPPKPNGASAILGAVNARIECIPAALGDRVFLDENEDGLQSEGEPGVPNVTVNLWVDDDEDGQRDRVLNTITTDENGLYDFGGLNPLLRYIVEFVRPDGREFTARGVGDDAALDSDADPDTGLTAPISLTSGDVRLDVDAGLLPEQAALASLGDRIFLDENEDGLQSEGEPGVPNITVNLWVDDDEDGQPDRELESTTTNGNGIYGFAGLDPVLSYLVQFLQPEERDFTAQNVGDDDSLDSDAAPTTGFTPPIVLSPGQAQLDTDAGLLPQAPAALGDRVFLDQNDDGLQSEGEPGVPNLTVSLWTDDDGDGEPDRRLETTKTDADGIYGFTDLDPALSYLVEFVRPEEREFTPQNIGGDDAVDSDANPDTGITEPITLNPGEIRLNVDAGFLPVQQEPAALGDRVFVDENENGLQDEGEEGVVGVSVNLWLVAGNVPDRQLATASTNENGIYAFIELNPALTYAVQFVQPAGREFTLPSVGDDDAVDSDADVETGFSPSINLGPGETQLNVDAGLLPGEPAYLGDRVFMDENEDGLQGEDEPGVPDAVVNLWVDDDQDGVPDRQLTTTTTDENGIYGFAQLDPSLSYVVEFVRSEEQALVTAAAQQSAFTLQSVGGNDALDSDADPRTGFTRLITLIPGEVQLNIDAGLLPAQPELAALGDHVFIDENGNGLQSEGEPGVPGVTVSLWVDDNGDAEPDRQLATTTTDESGIYGFAGLNPALSYLVQFIKSEDRAFTAQNAGDDDALDSDVDPQSGFTPPISLDSGEVRLNTDAGLLSTLSLDETSEPTPILFNIFLPAVIRP